MYVVGFAGPARVGKTAVTTELARVARDAGWTVHTMPFAGPLKKDAEERGFGKDSNPDEYRKFCQDHGAEMRAKNVNHWLDRWTEDLTELRNKHWEIDGSGPLLVIADDVRYENEHQAIRQSGGSLVFLHPGQRQLPEADAAWRTHESEMLANTMVGNKDMCSDLFDYTMMNDKETKKLGPWAKAFFNQVVNFPGSPELVCTCEGCNAMLENREASIDDLLKDLEDLMDGLGEGDDDE
jgi:hypothetical protein